MSTPGPHIRILIVSNTAWDDGNSFGNSFSNIFGGNVNYEIANIYCQAGSPNTKVCKRFFQISAKGILRSFLKRKNSSGHEVFIGDTIQHNSDELSKKSTSLLNFFKKVRWQWLFWGRDLLWATKRWKSKALDDFIKSFNPDLIFQPIYYSSYIDEIGLYAQRLMNVPMVGYISDDCVTLKHFSLSPFFWIDRFIKRPYVFRAIRQCELLYVITERQRQEYDEIFGKGKCKVLFKGGDFTNQPDYQIHHPLRLVYTGNIGLGRWKTLAQVATALETINQQETKAELFIYSATPVSQKMLRQLNRAGASRFMGAVPSSEVSSIQNEADILVHVESFELSERYKARLSFSTKIVDYLAAGRCILAIGWEHTGGIEYLRNNDAAVTVTDLQKLMPGIKKMIDEPSTIKEYAQKAFECGRRNHQIEFVRDSLYNDLKGIVSR